MKTKKILSVVFCCLFFSGCFDLETEIRILPDGSGFLTTWVRIDTRDANLAAALGGRGLNQEMDRTVANLQRAAEEVKGVDLMESTLYEEADKTVLRYKFLFDSPTALNSFLNTATAVETPILPAAGKLEFKGGTAKCGAYSSKIKFEPREMNQMFKASDPLLNRLDEAMYRQFLERIFSGRLRLRIVPPGQIKASDAPLRDIQGLPVYEKTLHELFLKGMEVRINSEKSCENSVEGKVPVEGVSAGSSPTPSEVAAVIKAMPQLAQIDIDFIQVEKNKAHLSVTLTAAEGVKNAVEFYLPVLFATFPYSMYGIGWSAEKATDGGAVYRFTSKEPIDFRKAKSPLIFVGKDGAKNVFRMHIPEFPYNQNRSPDTEERTVVTVKATLLENIVMSNASIREGKTATWRLTDKMLQNRVVLEALSE